MHVGVCIWVCACWVCVIYDVCVQGFIQDFLLGGGGHMATHASPTPSHSLGTSYHTQGCDQLTCFDMFRSGYVLDYLPHNLSGADTGFMKGGHHILNAAGGSA